MIEKEPILSVYLQNSVLTEDPQQSPPSKSHPSMPMFRLSSQYPSPMNLWMLGCLQSESRQVYQLSSTVKVPIRIPKSHIDVLLQSFTSLDVLQLQSSPSSLKQFCFILVWVPFPHWFEQGLQLDHWVSIKFKQLVVCSSSKSSYSSW